MYEIHEYDRAGVYIGTHPTPCSTLLEAKKLAKEIALVDGTITTIVPVERKSTTFRYALQYRPPTFGGAPKGWRYDEYPARAEERPNRLEPNIPVSLFRFGVIAYDRELTADEVRQYELVRV